LRVAFRNCCGACGFGHGRWRNRRAVLTGRVVDNAEILKPATRERVAALAKAHEDKTTDQIAVLTIPDARRRERRGVREPRLAAWKLGQKGRANGVLVVVAPQERKMRIEVGYGLEGTLTDVAASRIVRNVMTPAFKNGDFDHGSRTASRRSSRSSRASRNRRNHCGVRR
jgi:uncharacterized membrane protein YgcG